MRKDKSDATKKAMLVALEKALGVVTAACKSVGIARQTHYRWLEEDPDYAAAVAEIEAVTLDFAESRLHNLIASGDTAATIFFLKTKGKKRGYIEPRHHVLTGDEDGGPIQTVIRFIDDSKDADNIGQEGV